MISAKPLARRIALVTGAGTGFGARIAQELAKDGAYVLATDTDERAAFATTRRINSVGGLARLSCAVEAA